MMYTGTGVIWGPPKYPFYPFLINFDSVTWEGPSTAKFSHPSLRHWEPCRSAKNNGLGVDRMSLSGLLGHVRHDIWRFESSIRPVCCTSKMQKVCCVYLIHLDTVGIEVSRMFTYIRADLLDGGFVYICFLSLGTGKRQPLFLASGSAGCEASHVMSDHRGLPWNEKMAVTHTHKLSPCHGPMAYISLRKLRSDVRNR